MNTRTVILTVAAWCGTASAATITIDSQQGLFTSFAGVETMAITPHPVWEPNHPTNPGDFSDRDAVWISYADTGFDGAWLQPSGGTTPVATIYDTFRSGAGMLTLYVWAADTAGVFLDGNLLMPAAFTPGICSGEAIGCRPKDGGAISAALGEGQHTLSFELYQLGSAKDTNGNPFGLLFTGTAPASTETAAADAGAPEPGTWALLAGGLGWLMIRRRRNHIRS